MRRYSLGGILIVGLTLIPAAHAAPLQAAGYILTDVGVLPAPFNAASFPDAINNNGQVLIDSGQSNQIRAAIYTSEGLQSVGTLPAPYNYMSYGTGLNDLGQACGLSWADTSNVLTYHAFKYSAGTMTDLGTLPGYTYFSQARAINNSGQVVGDSESGGTTGSTAHAFLYSNGAMHDLGSLPGYASSVATAINNSGVIVGYSFPAFGAGVNERAFVDGPSGIMSLGTLPAPYNVGSEAHAINDLGDIVGTSYDSAGNSHAFLWSNGVMTDLGTLPGFTSGEVALSINNEDRITGYSTDSGGGTNYFPYSNGTMTNLNSMLYTAFTGYQLTSFGSINDAGQIAAAGYPPSGPYQVVLLSPAPEPAGASLIALCAIGLLGRTRRLRA